MRRGMPSQLTDDRCKKLEQLGFVWQVQEPNQTWDIRYKQLLEYKAIHGNCLVPACYNENPALGKLRLAVFMVVGGDCLDVVPPSFKSMLNTRKFLVCYRTLDNKAAQAVQAREARHGITAHGRSSRKA